MPACLPDPGPQAWQAEVLETAGVLQGEQAVVPA
jgi:hypothetical protein